MERNGPAIAREALGPLRRLMAARERPRSLRFSYALPVAVLPLIGLGIATGQFLAENRHLPPWLTVVLAVGTVLPVAVCVHRPLLAWRLAYVMMFAGVWHAAPQEAWPWNPVQILAVLAVFGRTVLTEDSPVIAWALVLTLVPVLALPPAPIAGGMTVLLVAIALAGDVRSRRRRARRQLAAQAELTELERARRAVLEERARIAREMHDVVAHHMSMIAVQAETAPFRVDGLPPAADREFTAIAAAARAALGDMRRLLGVLRSADSAAERAPQPGLGEMNALVETAARAGMPVSLELTGSPGSTPAVPFGVPEAVGLAAYRIVQEALANAARHAPGGAVHVECRGSADRLEVSVRSEITRAAEPEATGHGSTRAAGSEVAGHGLVGMRERAALLGGSLTAGLTGDGGYRVAAVLPYPVADA
jgi:signal transduction histidine kinase